MVRLIPFVIAALAILVLTFVEGSMTDRWVDVNQESAYCATLLDQIPAKIGKWEGADQEVDSLIQKTAGAQGFVSRTYRNKSTDEQVAVWLIVGHARDTAEHTPDICYPSSGFDQSQAIATYPIEVEGEAPAKFFTAIYSKGSTLGKVRDRVFWSWFKPSGEAEARGDQVEWIAPENSRFYFGSTRALYKLYFTARAPSGDQDPSDSVCVGFAKEFLPVANSILAKANGGVPEGFKASAPSVSETPSASETKTDDAH